MKENWVLDRYDQKKQEITLRKITKEIRKPIYEWSEMEFRIKSQLCHYRDIYPYQPNSRITSLEREFFPLFSLSNKIEDNFPDMEKVSAALPAIHSWKFFKGALNHFLISSFTARIINDRLVSLGKERMEFYVKGLGPKQQTPQNLAANVKYEETIISYLHSVAMKLKCADDAIKEMEYYVTDNKESLKVEWPENIFNYKEFFELLLSTNDAYLQILHVGYKRYHSSKNKLAHYSLKTLQNFIEIVQLVPEIKAPFISRNSLFSLYFKVFALEGKLISKKIEIREPVLVSQHSGQSTEEQKRLKRQQKRRNAKNAKNAKNKEKEKQKEREKQNQQKQNGTETEGEESGQEHQQQTLLLGASTIQKISNLSLIPHRIPITLTPQFLKSFRPNRQST